MKKIFTILLLLWFGNANGQPVFEHIYKNLGAYEPQGGYGVSYFDTISDGNLIICGTGTVGIEFSGTFIIKTEKNGNALWSKFINTSRGPWSVLETTDGGFLLTSTQPAAWINWQQRVLLVKLDADGDTVWSNSVGLPPPTIDYNSVNLGISSVEKADGNFFTVAYSSPTQAGLYNILLYESAPDGTFLWGKKIGNAASEIVAKIIKAGDYYYVIGETELSGSPANGILLLKINSSGTVIWTKSYRTSLGWVRDAMVKDDELYISGTTAQGLMLTKIDTSGTFIWAKEYAVNATVGQVNAISLTDDNGVLLGGYLQTTPKKSVIIRTDALGDTLWTKCYGNLTDHRSFRAIELNDTCFLTGAKTLSNNAIYYPYLSRISTEADINCSDEVQTTVTTVSDLTVSDTTFVLPEVSYGAGRAEHYSFVINTPVDSVTCDIITSSNSIIPEQTNLFQVYPNPTTTDLTIEAAVSFNTDIQGEIKNTFGQTVYTFNDKINKGLYKKTIDLTLGQGIYFLTLQTNQGLMTKRIEIVK